MGRPRQFDPDQVLDQAMRLFWSKGYEATSLEDLLAATGLARQSLYNAFGDKHALFLATLRRYDERSGDTMRGFFEGAGPVRERLRDFMMDIVDRTGERRRRGCLLVNSAVELSSRDPETARLVAAEHRVMERVLGEALARAQARGELSGGEDPLALARFLVVVLHGLNVATKAGAGREALIDAVNSALRALD